LLTPVAFAHLVMGDGQPIPNRGLRLCTDSFKILEVAKLMNVLVIKYRINCSMQFLEGKPRIYIPVNNLHLLASIVKPYMSKDMLYKLQLEKAVVNSLIGRQGQTEIKPVTEAPV
jgi:hypothetical protein